MSFEDIHDGLFAYDIRAWQELERRYGQVHLIMQACEERLLSIPKFKREVAERLNSLSVLMKRSRYALADKFAASNLNSVQFLTAIVNDDDDDDDILFTLSNNITCICNVH